jgi:hypothetical protein
MAKILSINLSRSNDLQTMSKAVTSPSMENEECPGEQPAPRWIFPACVGCPLLEVCSDECGMNDANGYY